MKKKQKKAADAVELRLHAEQRLSEKKKSRKSDAEVPRTLEATTRLVFELETHQIELEMQNEELRQANAKVEALASQYADIYDFAPMTYLTLDRDGAIRQVNLTGAILLGVERSELARRRFGLFVAGRDQLVFRDFLGSVFTREAKESCEVTLVREGLPPLMVRIEAVRSADEQECRAVVIDITERKQAEEKQDKLEEQLRQAQKMESIGQLAGGVAHDFNNLLFAIVGNSEMIKKECPDEASRTYAQQISDIALKGGTLTRQLLTFARKGQYVISLSDVRKAIANVANILNHSIDKRISLKLETGAEPLLVKTDAVQLENAILNLALNARDAMPKGGQLVLAAGEARLDEAYCSTLAFECLPGDYVEITVSDTGIGMDKETLSHIFEPFFTTKEPGKGTGLGLSSVFGFAKQMNGHVHATSEKGRGSIFKIRLPLSREKEAAYKEEGTVIVKGSGHILLVEDDQNIRDLVRGFLAELEYSVACCVDGEAGVRYFKENSEKTDLVILDLIMPKLGGYDCFMEMNKINPSIPVIISSGFGIDTEVRKILEIGAKGFIQKPYRFDVLLRLISETIRKR